jgi:hypothetical protein
LGKEFDREYKQERGKQPTTALEELAGGQVGDGGELIRGNGGRLAASTHTGPIQKDVAKTSNGV